MWQYQQNWQLSKLLKHFPGLANVHTCWSSCPANFPGIVEEYMLKSSKFCLGPQKFDNLVDWMPCKIKSLFWKLLACCVMAPTHYLNLRWLVISEFCGIRNQSNFWVITHDINLWDQSENIMFRIPASSPRSQWLSDGLADLEITSSCLLHILMT